jgi:hypothetical protein
MDGGGPIQMVAIRSAMENTVTWIATKPRTYPQPKRAANGKLEWSTPTLTEISFEELPVELRMMALGLPFEHARRAP